MELVRTFILGINVFWGVICINKSKLGTLISYKLEFYTGYDLLYKLFYPSSLVMLCYDFLELLWFGLSSC